MYIVLKAQYPNHPVYRITAGKWLYKNKIWVFLHKTTQISRVDIREKLNPGKNVGHEPFNSGTLEWVPT